MFHPFALATPLYPLVATVPIDAYDKAACLAGLFLALIGILMLNDDVDRPV